MLGSGSSVFKGSEAEASASPCSMFAAATAVGTSGLPATMGSADDVAVRADSCGLLASAVGVPGASAASTLMSLQQGAALLRIGLCEQKKTNFDDIYDIMCEY